MVKKNLLLYYSYVNMDIDFDNPKHQNLVNNYEALCKKYNRKGVGHAKEILAALDILKAVDTLFEVPHFYRPHPLRGIYRGCFAVDVNNIHRVIFRPNEVKCPDFRIDNCKSIVAIIIIEIFKNYH